jgi:hypothetical protein
MFNHVISVMDAIGFGVPEIALLSKENPEPAAVR